MSIRSSFVRYLSSSAAVTTIPLLFQPPSNVSTPVSNLQILSWGRGTTGQLGTGKEETRYYPSPTASLILPSTFRLTPNQGCLSPSPTPNFTQGSNVGISCGLFHSSVVVDGKLWVWGKGDGGRLGFGNEDSLFVPTRNEMLREKISSVALGGLHSIVLTQDGKVYSW